MTFYVLGFVPFTTASDARRHLRELLEAGWNYAAIFRSGDTAFVTVGLVS